MADNLIIQMQDYAGNNQYPATLASIVYDDNGKTVAERLAALEVLLKMFEWGDTEHKSVKAKYHLWSVGQVSASGKGEEGEGGGGAGMMLLTEWDDSITDLSSYALGANLGKGLRDEIAAMKANPSSFITLKTINNQSLFGSGNIEVQTTVEWSDIVGRPTNLSEFTNDKGYITEVTERMIVDATDAIPNSGKVLISTGGTLNWLPYPRNLSDLTDDVVAGKYLPLSGGTVTGNGAGLLVINRQDGNPVIEFRYNSSIMGRYGFATDGTPIGVVNGSQVTLLHSGNVGEYALKVDGSNAMEGGISWKESLTNDSANTFPEGLIMGRHTDTSYPIAGMYHAALLNCSAGSYRFQLASHAATDNILAFRGYDANSREWKDWRTIAFTDSDITGNAATATDADMLDGYHASAFARVGIANNLIHNTNEFTFVSAGYTGDVWFNYRTASMLLDGNITGYVFGDGKGGALARIAAGEFIGNAATATYASTARALVAAQGGASVAYVSGNIFYIGDTIYPTTATHILGKDVRLRYGESATNGLILNSSGNITIGSTDKLGTNADIKLYVDGGIRFAPRTIWGQSFDGMDNVTAPPTMPYVYFANQHSEDRIGYIGKGATNENTIYIAGLKDDARIYLFTGAGDAAHSIIFNSTGNVLVGTINDIGGKLQVAGNVNIVGYRLYWGDSDYYSIGSESDNSSIPPHLAYRGYNGHRFYYYNGEAMRINEYGRVGIGTPSPAYLLDVAGTGRFTGLASFDAGVKIGTTTLGNTNLGLSINTSFYPSSVGLSLGHSSYRWHNVYANNVRTDEVKIGDATLTWDGVALKVDKPFFSTSQVSAGSKAVEAQAVIAPLELTSKPTASTTTEYTDAEIASQFGLTSDVLANLARGIYTRVTYKSIIESLVWSYEVYYVGESKTIIFRNGTGSTYNSRNYKFERDSTTGKWKITNA